MAEAVVSFVIERLGDSAIQEVKFWYGVDYQVTLAQRELRLMQAFLRDADVRQRDEETVRMWVAEIRDAAYDLEDVIEVYAFKVAFRRRGGFKYVVRRIACIFKEGVDLHKIGSKIRSISSNLNNLRSSMEKYNIRQISETRDANTLQQKLRRTYSHVIGGDVVGLEDNVNQVVMHLVKDDTSCHRVVSIWGMGGLGKTTLAKQVYHHREIRNQFDCFAWMCISQQCNVRKVWVGILLKLLSASEQQREEIGKMEDDEIAQKLYLLQQESRCLVVLDDVWRHDTWESLKAAFPLNGESKSRMLLTTRNREVALHSDRNGILHQPQFLNDNESWKLLEKMAITRQDQIQPETYSKMKDLGKKMLHHCGGLPLAITVLGGLLARKDSINEWEMVLKNVREFIRKGKSHETEYAGATWVMELSYDDLPFHLKPCFLYLGHFPEDSEIRVKMLTQLWIAEGFIPSQNQRYGSMETMEEVAYNWLSELVERCLVQVGMQGSIRKIKTCHLHDLVRDMCLLRADEENFLHVISLRKDETSSSSKTKSRMMGNVRRLAVYMDKNVDYVVHHDGLYSRLRSLLCFGPLDWKSIRLVRSMLKDLKFLRVLKLEQNVSPNETGKMVHLRYLSMKSKDMKWLPSSIADSTCLQTLDLRETSLSLRPNVVGKMKQLRHLYLPLSTEIGKQQVSSLENLQTLQIRSNSFDWKEMAELVSLRKLTLRLSSPLENIEQILKATCNTLNHIQSLSVSNELGIDYISGLSKLGQVTSAHAMQIVLSCRNIYKLKLTHVTVELPRDPQFYPNLTKLHLYSCCFNDNQMIVLEKLPNLTKVTLDMVKFGPKRKLLIFSKGGFPRLEVLSLNMNFSNIDDWMVEEGSMPNLCELSIHHWEKIRRLPEGLRYITTLQKIKITGMSKAYRTMIQKGGEDFYKVQHVRSLVFENIRDNQGRLIQSDDEDQSDDEFLNFA